MTRADDAHASGSENRLAQESSPYLLLHKNNPVDWYPWGPEALAEAREEGKPIFLSVGYSTCYWCHVMERESFSDPGIAELLNREFVPIKVDREERPDLDEIYMTATQILTRHGGWPNSVFLTPELQPFYAGTYFPPEDRYGRPGFATVLAQLAAAWKQRRVEVVQQSEELAEAMRRALEARVRPGEAPASPAAARKASETLAQRFDAEWGGFGDAPKFPSPSNLYLLQELAEDGDETAGRMLATTLDEMARGGIYDQLGGGFHRYATDREWRIPHFEKMLYDNGLLLSLYAREHVRTGDPEMARIVRETAAWIEREMTSPEGAFLSAIDAETDGHEGAYYVWTRQQLAAVLDEEERELAAPVLGFAGEPFFEGDHYVLHLPAPLAELAAARDLSREELMIRLAGPKGKLFAARGERQRPLTDDKVLTDWNGMAIAGLADAGRLLGDDDLVARAARAARFVLRELRGPGDGAGDGARDGAGNDDGEGSVLLHTWREGEAGVEAFLGDYAFFVRGLLALHAATGDGEWLAAAAELTAEQVRRLRAPRGGFFVAEESDELLFRSQDPFDGAIPSANAVAALNLVELARRSGEERWREEAEATLAAFAPLVEAYPDGMRMMALATLRHHRGGGEPETVGDDGDAPATAGGVRGLHREAESVVAVSAAIGAAGDDGWRRFEVRLEIADGWHVNANPASQEMLVPTAVEAATGELRAVEYPAGETFRARFSDTELDVYSGSVEIVGELRSGAEPGLQVTYQACDEDRCLPPVTVVLGGLVKPPSPPK